MSSFPDLKSMVTHYIGAANVEDGLTKKELLKAFTMAIDDGKISGLEDKDPEISQMSEIPIGLKQKKALDFYFNLADVNKKDHSLNAHELNILSNNLRVINTGEQATFLSPAAASQNRRKYEKEKIIPGLQVLLNGNYAQLRMFNSESLESYKDNKALPYQFYDYKLFKTIDIDKALKDGVIVPKNGYTAEDIKNLQKNPELWSGYDFLTLLMHTIEIKEKS